MVWSDDNEFFSITNNELKINVSPDYEVKDSYSIRIKSTDNQDLSYEKVFTLKVNDLNEVPSDINISSDSFNENIAKNSKILTLSTLDEDKNDTHTYELIKGTGSDDNEFFSIVNNELKINDSPDYEVKDSYSIRIKSTDNQDLSYEKVFTLKVNDLNEVPSDINISSDSFNENIAKNSKILTLSTLDEDKNDSHTYEQIKAQVLMIMNFSLSVIMN